MSNRVLFCLLLAIPFTTAESATRIAHDVNQPQQLASNTADDWLLVGGNYDGEAYIKKASFEKEGAYFSVITKYYFTYNKSVGLYKEKVSAADCRRGVGKIMGFSLDGKTLLANNDFAFGAESGASNIAEAICGMAKRKGLA